MKKLLIFLLCISFAYALPGDWVGEASISQNPVASGTEISVYAGSVLLAKTYTPSTDAGKENFGDDFYVLVFETLTNKDISFKICGIDAYNTTFGSGTHQKSLNVNKASDGTYGCTCDAVCAGGHCINPDNNGVCSSNNYYCNNNGVCESDYYETTSNCPADCKIQRSSGGGGAYIPKEETTLTQETQVTGNNTVITVETDYPESVIIVEEGSQETSLDFSSLLVKGTDKNTVTLSNNSIRIEKDTTVDKLTIEIPAGTVIDGSTDWEGGLMLPTIKEKSTVNMPEQDGQEAIVSVVIEMGSEEMTLFFSKAVRMFFKGQAEKQVAYTKGNEVHPITRTCTEDSQTAGDLLPDGADCKIILGEDLIVWTKHFTKFITYEYKALPVTEPVVDEVEDTTTEETNESMEQDIPEQEQPQIQDTEGEGIVGLTGRAVSGILTGIKPIFLWALLIVIVGVIFVGVYNNNTNNVPHLHTKSQTLHKMADKYHLRGQVAKSRRLHAKANELHRKAMKLKRNS
jgi:hypothetical protein